MTTKIVWVHPGARLAFVFLLLVTLFVTAWSLVFALIFGGAAFWWGVVWGAGGSILIHLLGEFTGSYDEKTVMMGDEDDGRPA